MTANNKSIGIIVLAAGESKRMHEPKQLLQFEGKSLLRRAVETALATNCAPVAVVLGANYEKTKTEIEDLNAAICFNPDFQKGLSSSLKKGLEKLLETAPEIDAFLVSLADQPLVAKNHLQKFIEKYRQTGKPVIAAKYHETVGVPAFFAKEIFSEFKEISGDKGAKAIIEKYRDELETIELPEAALDIDTKEDFLRLGEFS